jgi:hypothetical protein
MTPTGTACVSRDVDGFDEVLDTRSGQHRIMFDEQHVVDAVVTEELLEARSVTGPDTEIGLLAHGHTVCTTSLDGVVAASVVDDQRRPRAHRLTFESSEDVVDGAARVVRQNRHREPLVHRNPHIG